jgi:hypothetical protein
MKLLSRCSMILQQLTRLKLWPILVGKAVHPIDILGRAYLVEIAEWAAAEGLDFLLVWVDVVKRK